MLTRCFAALAVSLVAVSSLGAPQQVPFVSIVDNPTRPASTIDNHFGASDGFQILTHKEHPAHKLRIKKHDLDSVDVDSNGRESVKKYCEGATSGFTGYLSTDNDKKHFFFAYFESRSNPREDPLVMWLNGGPGCSSMTGLFMELGPCRVSDSGNSTVKNEYSWTEAANVFFLDQPIGVGFSWAEGAKANGTFAASEDIYAFISIWYKYFPESQQLPFSIAGESYGGHYIPIFASHIIEKNEVAIREGRIRDTIPLDSVIIGNGIFDPLHQATSSWDITCTNVTGIGPLFNATVCDKMASKISRCESLWRTCYSNPDPYICQLANGFCSKAFDRPYSDSGLNYYDISKPCSGELCYPIEDSIQTYLNREDVRAAFGVDAQVGEFYSCSGAVGNAFDKVGDYNLPTTTFVKDLLEHELRVLMYVGTYDWICNFVGNERFLLNLEWSGSYGYRHAATYDQKKWAGGEWWSFKNLVYARVHGAGHMVPYDKPAAALSMIKSWFAEEPLK